MSRDAQIDYCLAASGCVEVTVHSWVQTHKSRYTWMYTDASSMYVLLHVDTILDACRCIKLHAPRRSKQTLPALVSWMQC